jgi:hypothetical protein
LGTLGRGEVPDFLEPIPLGATLNWGHDAGRAGESFNGGGAFLTWKPHDDDDIADGDNLA